MSLKLADLKKGDDIIVSCPVPSQGTVKVHLNPDVSRKDQILEFVATLENNYQRQDKTYVTGRKRNTLSIHHLPPNGMAVVLKKSSYCAKGLPVARKIELLFKSLFKNYAATAFRGSMALVRAGIPTPKPLAWWQKNTSVSRQSFFLYQEEPAISTLSQYLQALWPEKQDLAESEACSLITQMADITRKMHTSGIQHGDIVTHNFLVNQKKQLCLLDTDHVSHSLGVLPIKMQTLYNLRCLKRLDFPTEGQRYFLQKYLGREIHLLDWAVFRFWYLGGFSLKRWIKRLKRMGRKNKGKQQDIPFWHPC